MITLHHLSTSHSHVVLWLMEELGEPYAFVAHQREASARAPDSLRAVHPAGKSPTIEDHGVAMIESTGIIMYILDACGRGRLRPAPDTAAATGLPGFDVRQAPTGAPKPRAAPSASASCSAHPPADPSKAIRTKLSQTAFSGLRNV